MKDGRSLQAVATELGRQRAAKRDFRADTRGIKIEHDGSQLFATLLDKKGVSNMVRSTIRPFALRQMEEHLGLPAKFADRLQEKDSDLLVHNMNELFRRYPSTQLTRFLDGSLRAFLSGSYRIIDNFDYANAVLAVLKEFPLARIESCEVTEDRLYIKVSRPDMVERIGWKEGMRMGHGHDLFDEVECAAVFSNSEIGNGKLWFRPAARTRKCTNLAVWEQGSLQKVHLGKKGDGGEHGVIELLSDETKQLEDAALWSKIKDLTRATLRGTFFQQQVAQLRAARENVIEPAKVAETVELLAEHFQLKSDEKDGILGHLIAGGDLTQYGMHSAVTRYSQDVDGYDRASELERLGGRIIELGQNDFSRLLKKAA